MWSKNHIVKIFKQCEVRFVIKTYIRNNALIAYILLSKCGYQAGPLPRARLSQISGSFLANQTIDISKSNNHNLRLLSSLLLVHVVTSANQSIIQQDTRGGLGVKSRNLVFFGFINVLV